MVKLFKTYKTEIFSLVLQAIFMYVYPLLLNPGNPLDVTIYSCAGLLIISFFNALFSKSCLRFWYPFAVLPLFIPAAFIIAPQNLLFFASSYLAAGYLGTGLVALPLKIFDALKKLFKSNN